MPNLITSSGQRSRIPTLDFLRTLAIVMVVWFHYPRTHSSSIWHSLGQWGWIGVDLFFVLSGYLIASQLLARPSTLSAFYWRRALRIWPAYLVVLAIYFAFPTFRERNTLSPLWKYLVFIQNFGLNLNTHGAFTHAWSLCVEEQFYLFFPLIVLCLAKRNFKWSLAAASGIFLLGLVARHLSWQLYVKQGSSLPVYFQDVYYPTYNRLDGLLVGVGVAALQIKVPQIWNGLVRHLRIVFIAGCLFLAAAIGLLQNRYAYLPSVLGFPIIATSFGAFIVVALNLPGRFKIPLASLGANLAFSIYLTHKGIIHWLQTELSEHGYQPTGFLPTIFILVMVISFAATLYWLVERPALMLRAYQPKIKIPQLEWGQNTTKVKSN